METMANLFASDKHTTKDPMRKSNSSFTRITSRAETYELEKFEKNLLIIFNHENFLSKSIGVRSGALNDEKSLLHTFEKLDFECDTYRDLRVLRLLQIMSTYGEKDYTDYGCLFVAILTHSDDKGHLLAYDTYYSEYDLIERLCTNETLFGKPVVFLIEASRGFPESVNLRIPVKSFFDKDLGDRIKADLVTFHGSAIGQPSFRNRNGSFFIQCLCRQMDMRADREDFESICRAVKREFGLDIEASVRVKDEIKKLKQMPVLTSKLIRLLYLGRKGYKNVTFDYEVTQSSSVAVCYPDLNVPTYVLGENNKNLMIIFNHENFLHNTRREGSAADAENLKSTFEQFGFEVTTHKDENMADMFDKLTKFSRQDFGACGCVCVAVLTHGSAHGFLEACDVGYSERALFAAFDALANRSLAGKPLVFLIQASRGAQPAKRICVPRLGERPDNSIQLDCAGGSKSARQIKYLPTESNMIIFHSCFRGKAVPEDARGGSCFVGTLCAEVRRRGAGEHLEKMFRRVRRLVAEAAPQMPVVTSTLLKKLYLKRSQPAPA